MDRYTKSFIVASLVYLLLAAVLGLWMGLGSAPGWATFAHVHFNLLGFMAMMVYGVGYFVIPRFNARPLRWPGWVPAHFYVANIGLVGMVATYPRVPSADFVVFAVLSVASAAIFAVNLISTVVGPEEQDEERPASRPEAVPVKPAPEPLPDIHPDMRMGEILTRWPHLGDVLAANGFPALGDPEHREQVKQLPVTLRMACQRHGVDLEAIGSLLREAARGNSPEAKAGAGGLQRGDAIGAGHVLGDILAAYPETEGIFRKYYGSGCFSCPGQATETVKQSSMMHNVDLRTLLADLNRAAGSRG